MTKWNSMMPKGWKPKYSDSQARESWLRSDDPDKFAAAMRLCKHSGAFCASDGFCNYDGACFKGSRLTVEKQLAKIEKRLTRIESLLKLGG